MRQWECFKYCFTDLCPLLANTTPLIMSHADWLIQDKHVNAVKFFRSCLGWAFEVATQEHKENQQRLCVWDSEWMFLSIEGGRWEKLNGRHQNRNGKCLGSGVYQCVFFFSSEFCAAVSVPHWEREQCLSEINTTERAGSERGAGRVNEEKRKREGKEARDKERQSRKKQKWFLKRENVKERNL